MPTTIPDAKAEAIIALFDSADVYVSLHSADPGKTGANEIAGTGYARQVIATATGWTAAAADVPSGGRVRDNVAKLDFGTAGSAWGTITHLGLWSAVTAGTWVGGASLTTPQTVASGNAVYFPIGDLDLVGAGAP